MYIVYCPQKINTTMFYFFFLLALKKKSFHKKIKDTFQIKKAYLENKTKQKKCGLKKMINVFVLN